VRRSGSGGDDLEGSKRRENFAFTFLMESSYLFEARDSIEAKDLCIGEKLVKK
jgi:hypothetical protein